MSHRKHRIIQPGERLNPATDFNSDDTLLSLGDIALSGAALVGIFQSPADFATRLVCLSHLVTHVVLSERVVFFDQPESESDVVDPVVALLHRYCSTIAIDERHPVPAAIIKVAFDTPEEMLDSALVTDIRSSVPWSSGAAGAWLAEYAAASAIGVPFAPDPFLSQPLGVHAARAMGSEEILIRYVEDLRRSTTEETNLLRQLAIYDVQLPAIFAAVLRESREPADLIRVASEMNADAKSFRTWCRALDSTSDPKVFNERLRAAQESLDRLGRSIRSDTGERMQVPVPAGPGGTIELPSRTLKKVVDWLDVDVRFVRPRHFLLNLLASARQVGRLRDELARVFGVPADFAAQAADWIVEASSVRKPG